MLEVAGQTIQKVVEGTSAKVWYEAFPFLCYLRRLAHCFKVVSIDRNAAE